MDWFDVPAEPQVVELSYPTRVVLGAGALQRLPMHVERIGMRKPLLVSDAGVHAAGLVDRVLETLRGTGLSCSVFAAVHPNPTEKDVFDGLAAFRSAGCDGFIALGGGSPIDAAKVIQLSITHPPPLSRYDDATGGDRFVQDNMPPLIAIPTTAGTGSEVGRSGVITLKDTGRKTVLFSPFLLPKVAICDPELTYELPPHVTAATGLDALTHCLESYCASGFHPLADAVAFDGLRRVVRSLPVVMKHPKDLPGRTDMMIAALEGAMALQKGLGACHALAHALTPVSGVHHGLANAVVLPTVLEFNKEAARARLAQLAHLFGDGLSGTEAAMAASTISHLGHLLREVGIPTRLREVGVKEADLSLIAEKAFADASHLTNPRPCTEADLRTLIESSF